MENKIELLHENRFFKIFRGKCHYLKYHGSNLGYVGSSVLIFNEDKTKILLIKNYRDAIKMDSWETPRGGGEDNEKPVDCAKREALEETGYNVHNLKSLGKIAPETGTMTSNDELFTGTAKESDVPDIVDTDDLISEVKWFDKETVFEMIKNEEIVCGITISMIFKNEILYKD